MNEFELRKELRVRIHQYKDVVYKEETHKYKTINYSSLKKRLIELNEMQDTLNHYDVNSLPKEIIDCFESILKLQDCTRII